MYKPSSKNNYWKLIILVLMFFGPIFIASILFRSNHNHLLKEPANNGYFVHPAADFSQLQLNQLKKHPWLLVYVSSLPCIGTCERNLYNLTQVWTALGKNQKRVHRVLITFPKENDAHLDTLLTSEYKDTQHIAIAEQQITQFFYNLPVKNISPLQGAFYIVDPLNNLIMAYPADIAPQALLKDLNRLLSASTTG